jgi:site-specific recombinase XerD
MARSKCILGTSQFTLRKDERGGRVLSLGQTNDWMRAGVGAATQELRSKLVKWMEFAGIEPGSADRGLSSHSMRRGLVTELRSAGADSRAIADHVGLATIGLVEGYSDSVSTASVLDVLDL